LAKTKDIGVCPFGYNYQRVTQEVIVAGVCKENYSHPTKKWRKNIKHRAVRVLESHWEKALAALENFHADLDVEIEKWKEKKKREWFETVEWQEKFLEQLRPEIEKGLFQIHDYKQLNAQIAQNINVIIEEKYEGANFDEKLKKASEQEKAIYYATKLLEEKLNVSKFLYQPEWLNESSECRRFGVHQMVMKYYKIYKEMFRSKSIEFNLAGISYNQVVANPQAASVIIHTFLDNAAKYAPKHSQVNVYVEDLPNGGVQVLVESYGPRILNDEREKIFDPAYRGRVARKVSKEGTGFGLYVSQFIAKKHFDSPIRFEQEPRETSRRGHLTRFIMVYPPCAPPCKAF